MVHGSWFMARCLLRKPLCDIKSGSLRMLARYSSRSTLWYLLERALLPPFSSLKTPPDSRRYQPSPTMHDSIRYAMQLPSLPPTTILRSCMWAVALDARGCSRTRLKKHLLSHHNFATAATCTSATPAYSTSKNCNNNIEQP